MTNAWDRPPAPRKGDTIDTATYVGVGRVVSRWESVEFDLSRLYSLFVGDSDGPAMQTYGEPSIFRDRLARLDEGADRYFAARPSQEHEGTLAALRSNAEGFSARRNEIAHGIVFNLRGLSYFDNMFGPGESEQYAVIPPLYALRFHCRDSGEPTYVYTSFELSTIERGLVSLMFSVRDFRIKLSGVPEE